ncbi:MAG: hypothetical protein FGM14_04615 [Flavobacteriales bacterium]|nr:hypothetical protein [Flavobacteriales bacterium]
MKKILFAALTLLAGTNFVHGQFGDLKKAIKEVKGGNDAPAISLEELLKIGDLPQQAQAKLFFEKHGYTNMGRISAYGHSKNFSVTSETQPILTGCSSVFPSDAKAETDASGNIIKFLFNFNSSFEQTCYPFEIIHPTGAYAYGYGKMSEKYVDGTRRVESKLITVFDNFILINTYRENGKYGVNTDFHIVAPKAIVKQLAKNFTYESFVAAINPVLQTYYDQMQVLLKGGDQKVAEEKRAKFGIKGKEVVSLSIEPSSTNKVFQGQTFNFDIIATLKDGTKLSTRQGFKDEYDIQVEGLELVKHTDVDGTVSIWYDIAKKYIPKNDQLRIIVKSKFHPNLKAAEYTQKIDYENCEWVFSDNGDQSSNAAYRKSAGTFRVEVKSSKDLNTGKDCFEYKVYNNNEIAAHFKQVKTKPISVSANGGRGAKPNFGNQNGGNGGNITLVKDPSAKDCKIIFSVSGGQAYSAAYQNGATGSFNEIEQKVNW